MSSREYEDALCPGCGQVLTGSREPGERDYCQHADKEVTLKQANLNDWSYEVLSQEKDPHEPMWRATRNAIDEQRAGERVPVHFNLQAPGAFYDHGVKL